MDGAPEVTTALSAASERVLGYEDRLAASCTSVLAKAGKIAAANFEERAQATTVTAAGEGGWEPPHADELIDVEAIVSELRTKSDPVRRAAIAAYGGALAGTEANWDVANPLVGGVLAGAAQHVTSIADTTRINLMRIIDASYQEGLSVEDTAKAIRVGMADASKVRGRLIARTEIAAVTNGGSLAASKILAETSGEPLYKRWLTAPGAHYPRHEDYDELDGQTVGLDDAFDVGGVALQFPGDPDGPPEEICNCRCTLLYVGSPDEGQETEEPDVTEAAAPEEVSDANEAEVYASDDVPEGFEENVFDWPEEASDTGGAAIMEAQSGTGDLWVLREAPDLDAVAAVANVERGADSLIVHNVASGGGGFGETLLREVARRAADDGLGVRFISTPGAVAYYRDKLGLVVAEDRTVYLTPEEAKVFGRAKLPVETGADLAPDTTTLTPTNVETQAHPTLAAPTTGQIRSYGSDRLWEAWGGIGQAKNVARAELAVTREDLLVQQLWQKGLGRLPPGTVRLNDLVGDQQVHTYFSDGHQSVRDIAEDALKHGQTQVVISDHSHLLTADEIISQHAEIDALNRQYQGRLRILKGIEANILPDGALDLSADELRRFDVVNAAIHKSAGLPDGVKIGGTDTPAKVLTGHPGTTVGWEKRTDNLIVNKASPTALDRATVEDFVRYADFQGIPLRLTQDAIEPLGEVFLNAHGFKDLPANAFSIRVVERQPNPALKGKPFTTSRTALGSTTERLLSAMDDTNLTVLVHPHSVKADWKAVAAKAADRGIPLEVNGRDMLRNGTQDEAAKMIAAAKEAGAKLAFGSDAHTTNDLVDYLYGVRFAAQHGVTAEDIAPLARKRLVAETKALTAVDPAEITANVAGRERQRLDDFFYGKGGVAYEAVEDAKDAVMKDLAGKLRGDKSFQGLVERLKDSELLSVNRTRTASTDATEQTISFLVRNWASTAADDHEWALAMQRAVKDEFKLPEQILDHQRGYYTAEQEKLMREAKVGATALPEPLSKLKVGDQFDWDGYPGVKFRVTEVPPGDELGNAAEIAVKVADAPYGSVLDTGETMYLRPDEVVRRVEDYGVTVGEETSSDFLAIGDRFKDMGGYTEWEVIDETPGGIVAKVVNSPAGLSEKHFDEEERLWVTYLKRGGIGEVPKIARDTFARYEEDGGAMRAFVRQMYEHTQEQLREAGISEVLVYRGQGLTEAEVAGTQIRKQLVELQPASSFSSSIDTAYFFSQSPGAIMGGRIPAERILGTARTGFGSLEETELVVLGSPTTKDEVWGIFRGDTVKGASSMRPRLEYDFWRQIQEATGGPKIIASDVVRVRSSTLKVGDVVSGDQGLVLTYISPKYEYQVVAIRSDGEPLVRLVASREGRTLTALEKQFEVNLPQEQQVSLIRSKVEEMPLTTALGKFNLVGVPFKLSPGGATSYEILSESTSSGGETLGWFVKAVDGPGAAVGERLDIKLTAPIYLNTVSLAK